VLPQYTLTNSHLTDAINYFHQVTGVNVVLRSRTLQAAGIDPNTPVTLHLTDIPAAWALEQTLRAAAPGYKLDYEIYDGIITISTVDDLNQDLVTRVYDLRGLVAKLLQAPPKSPGRQFILPSPADSESTPSAEDLTQSIRGLIRDDVGPDTWMEYGGTSGRMEEIDGRLLVINSRLVQARIAGLLDEIANAVDPVAAAQPTAPWAAPTASPAPVPDAGHPLAAISADPSIVANDCNAFALDLYSHLARNSGNLSFSPYSISSALAMTYAGARGRTAKQMAQTLHFSVPGDTVHAAYAKLSLDLDGGGQMGNKTLYQLAVANALWGQSGMDYNPDFLYLLRDYGTDVREADFIKAADAAADKINEWVKLRTLGKIPKLISPGILNAQTRLVLVNAIYFKASWLAPFEPDRTRQSPFHLDSTNSVQVPLMHQGDAKIAGMENDELQAVDMPYVGGQLSMVILLPRRIDGLADLESKLNSDYLSAWPLAMKYRSVDLSLPKFTVDSSFELADVLPSMGMVNAFDGDADFSGISDSAPLHLTHAIHKALVHVDEEGTEAAAATAIVGGTASEFGPPPITFRADHPFLFLIRDQKSGVILFMGRVTNPK
jgi:serpin B